MTPKCVVSSSVQPFIGIRINNSPSDLADLLDDLAELRYLLDNLDQIQKDIHYEERMGTSSDLPYREVLNHLIKTVENRCLESEKALNEVVHSADYAAMADRVNAERREYLISKSKLRFAFRQQGVLFCANDWESPWHDCPIPPATNRNQLHQEIGEDAWNYKRDGHLDALVYEQVFAEEYLSHLGSSRLKVYLTNCGMAAFSSVLHWLTKELPVEAKSLALLPMYCETLPLVKHFFSNCIERNSKSPSELISTLLQYKPQVIFLDAVTNSDEVLANDVRAVMNWAKHETKQKTFVVVDTSCMPSPLLSPQLLYEMPDHVTIVFVESLAKLHQYGMDIVTAGLVAIDASENLHQSFKESRRALGTNITDVNARALPQPNRTSLVRRLKRLSRNVNWLATQLENNLERGAGGLIESVSWVREGTPAAAWYHGAYLVILFPEPCFALQYYREFEKIILQLAHQRRHPIGRGTSFGFDVSRLYAPVGLSDRPVLRLAVGTETVSGINTLAEIISDAAVLLKRKNNIFVG